MSRIYHGHIKNINSTDWTVELWNGTTAATPDASIELKIAGGTIVTQGENDTLYENPIRSTRVEIGFTCHKVSTNLPDSSVQTNLHNIATDEEQKWAILIYKGSTLYFVGRVLADQIRYERSSEHAEIVKITACDALELIKNYDVDPSWFSSSKITVTNLISRILKTTGLVDYWTTAGTDSTFLCDATQQTATNQTGTRHLGYNQLPLISFVDNYDPFTTDANIKYVDCYTALENVLKIYNARIIQDGAISCAYWVTQPNAYDDSDFTYEVYDYNGNFVSTGNTLTHRVSIGTTARPLWEAKPTISFQPPVRTVEVEYSKLNGALAARNLADATTGYIDITHDDILTTGKVRVTFDLAWDVPAGSVGTRYKYQIKYKVFGRNPSNNHIYLYSTFKDTWDDFGAGYSVGISNLDLGLTDWGKGIGEKIFTQEYPALPSGVTELRAMAYITQIEERTYLTRSRPPAVVWGTYASTDIDFSGFIRIEQAYTDTDFSAQVKTESTFSTPRDKNSTVAKIESKYYDGKKNDVGTIFIYTGSAYVPATAWQTPWSATWDDSTVSIQQILSGSILALYQDFLMTINGNWIDAGNYTAVKSLFFDSAIWIFNGGRLDLETGQWDGEWLRVTPVYTNLNNNGEGERIGTSQTDKNTDKIDILIGEVSRLGGAVGNIGGVLIGDIINNGNNAPTSDPAMDMSYGVQIAYNNTDKTMEWQVSQLPSPSWIEIVKKVEELKNSDNTLTDDAELTFPMLANKLYLIRIKIPFYTVAAADFKVGIVGATSPATLNARFKMVAPDGTQTQSADATYLSHSVTSASSGNGFIDIDISCENGSNAGTFAVQWAQNTSNAGDTKVYAGAYLEYKEMESTAPTALDTDAVAFFTAAGITDATEKAAVNQLVIDLKAASIWTKLHAIYPFVGGSAGTHKYNLKDPADTDAAFRLTFAGGWTHSSTGVTPNGTTGEADTHWEPDVEVTTSSLSFGAYIRNDDKTGTQIYGAYSSYFTQNNLSADNMISGSGSNLISTSNTTTKRLFVHSRTSSTLSTAYQDGSSIGSETTSCAGLPNVNFFFGSRNRGAYSDFFDGHEYAFAFLGDGLNSGEVTDLNNAVNDFETTLSRNV